VTIEQLPARDRVTNAEHTWLRAALLSVMSGRGGRSARPDQRAGADPGGMADDFACGEIAPEHPRRRPTPSGLTVGGFACAKRR
jgi:hypothetical protein